MSISPRSFALGRWAVAVAVLVDRHVASAQTFKFPEGATPTEFQGYVTETPGLVETWQCNPGSTHTTQSTWAACCVEGQNCEFYTGCDAGTATRMDGSTYVCAATIPDCYTMTIHESYPSAAQSWSVIGCVQPGFYASNAYREIVVGGTTTPTPGPSTSSTGTAQTGTAPSDSSSAPVETGAANNTPQTNSPASETDSSASETNSSPSQAWIAGAVIGPVAAIALVGFLVFWLRRRRGSREPPESHAGYQESETTKTQSVWSPEMPKSELSGGTVPAELADQRPFELDSSPINPYGAGGYGNERKNRG